MVRPKVSVVIPVFGVELYIERCANSLFSQTLDGIEFIFIDDCTPDNSINILKQVIENNRPRFAGKQWEVRIVRMPTNSGLPAVRRHGIQLATGEFIIHCDSDDWVDATMYEELFNKAIKEDADVVLCKYKLSDGVKIWDDPSFTCPIAKDKDSILKQLLNWEISGSLCTKFVKRSLYTDDIIYPKDNMCEDIALSVQLILRAEKITVIENAFYYYYINNNSICHQNDLESSRRNAIQRVNNAKIIESAFIQHSVSSNFHNDILVLKSRILASGRALPRRLYINAFKIDNFALLVNYRISVRNRIGHLLKLIGLYDLLGRY